MSAHLPLHDESDLKKRRGGDSKTRLCCSMVPMDVSPGAEDKHNEWLAPQHAVGMPLVSAARHHTSNIALFLQRTEFTLTKNNKCLYPSVSKISAGFNPWRVFLHYDFKIKRYLPVHRHSYRFNPLRHYFVTQLFPSFGILINAILAWTKPSFWWLSHCLYAFLYAFVFSQV